jgi:hypothetical protein
MAISNVIVILDSHIRDIPFVEVAKEIVNRKSCKQIIFTTTLPWYNIDLTAINNNNSAIQLKPFEFPELLSLLDHTTTNELVLAKLSMFSLHNL